MSSMVKFLILISVLFTFLYCRSESKIANLKMNPIRKGIDENKKIIPIKLKSMIKIGDVLPEKILSDEYFVQFTDSAGFLKAYLVVFNRIEYTIGINEKRKIVYIRTEDIDFLSHEGFSISTTFKQIIKNRTMKLLPYWAYYVPLRDGWNASFKIPDYPDPHERERPDDNATIDWFFKE